MYRYIIAPARDSICSRGTHSPLRGPNSRCASLLPIMSLFHSSHCHYMFHYITIPIRFH